MKKRQFAIAIALALLPLAGVAHAQIAWTDCTTDLVGAGATALGDRLQCGTLQAPLDHMAPDGRLIDVGVVRVRAAAADQRQGALFVNTGGPGAHPARLLVAIAGGWSQEDPNDPDTADKYRLAQRFDLIAVIPRGLRGGWEYRCLSGLPPRYAFLPSHLDDDNWQKVIEEASEQSAACAAPAEARFISTEQHVHDMDMVRRALGDATLHFYGISYGGRVGGWYAAMYPTHVGRMLLDSPMLFTHDFRAAMEMTQTARRKQFQQALAPIVAEPVRYGLPDDPSAIAASFDELPGRTREMWHPFLDSTPRVAAALWIAGWIREAEPVSQSKLEGRIRRQTFSADTTLDRDIRWAAMQLAAHYFATPPAGPRFDAGQDGDSVRLAVGCNDSRWAFSDDQIRARAVNGAARYLHSSGDDILEELVCSRWPHPTARLPDLTRVELAPPFLLLQSENDVATPAEGSRNLLARYTNARLLTARGSSVHGVFNFTTSQCIERTVARYLLDGTLPASESRESYCEGTNENPLSALPHTPAPPSPPATPAPHDEI
jgi:pimeloyl-ACP methyl ester carboxylesterase